jgi:hypothetical protein
VATLWYARGAGSLMVTHKKKCAPMANTGAQLSRETKKA